MDDEPWLLWWLQRKTSKNRNAGPVNRRDLARRGYC